MTQREHLMTESFFRDEMAYIEETIASRLAKLRDQPQVYTKGAIFMGANARERLQLMLLAYSAGDPVTAIAPRLAPAIEAWHAYLATPGNEGLDLRDLDDHLTLLWLVSFALLFKTDAATWQRLLALLDQAGSDALVDRLVASRSPGRAIGTLLNHLDIFGPLLQALDAKPFDQAAQLGRYLGGWYRKMADTYWHDAHQGPAGGASWATGRSRRLVCAPPWAWRPTPGPDPRRQSPHRVAAPATGQAQQPRRGQAYPGRQLAAPQPVPAGQGVRVVALQAPGRRRPAAARPPARPAAPARPADRCARPTRQRRAGP